MESNGQAVTDGFINIPEPVASIVSCPRSTFAQAEQTTAGETGVTYQREWIE